jgi:hypothetical protein
VIRWITCAIAHSSGSTATAAHVQMSMI